MLTRPVAAVKFDLSSTPEQAALAMKIDEGLKTFWNVVEHRFFRFKVRGLGFLTVLS